MAIAAVLAGEMRHAVVGMLLTVVVAMVLANMSIFRRRYGLSYDNRRSGTGSGLFVIVVIVVGVVGETGKCKGLRILGRVAER
jgi:hypothetical protein